MLSDVGSFFHWSKWTLSISYRAEVLHGFYFTFNKNIQASGIFLSQNLRAKYFICSPLCYKILFILKFITDRLQVQQKI